MGNNIFDKFRLDGKTAVVTGAAGNIGYHTAQTFAQAGAKIAIVDLPVCLERSKEIAKEFGVKPNQVGSWMSRAVQKMRVTLDFSTSSFMLFTTGSSMLVSLAPTMVQLSRTSHSAT